MNLSGAESSNGMVQTWTDNLGKLGCKVVSLIGTSCCWPTIAPSTPLGTEWTGQWLSRTLQCTKVAEEEVLEQ